MPFNSREIREDHFNKTHMVKSGKRKSSDCCITRDCADIATPQGKKFLNTTIYGIAHYTRIENPSKGKGAVVVRRRAVKDPIAEVMKKVIAKQRREV